VKKVPLVSNGTKREASYHENEITPNVKHYFCSITYYPRAGHVFPKSSRSKAFNIDDLSYPLQRNSLFLIWFHATFNRREVGFMLDRIGKTRWIRY